MRGIILASICLEVFSFAPILRENLYTRLADQKHYSQVLDTGPIQVEAFVIPEEGAKAELQIVTLPQLEANEVEVEMLYNGLCHTDIHMRDNDWQISNYPMVAGHEGIGRVRLLGSAVKTHSVGQLVGVSWIRDSCQQCSACKCGRENICRKGYQGLYLGSAAGIWGKKDYHEYGGCFSRVVRIEAKFAFQIPENLPAELACPLMCGGGTVFEPIIDYCEPGTRVGIIGVGGLGTAAIRLSSLVGGVVTAFSRSPEKKNACLEDGASEFVLSSSTEDMAKLKGTLDLLIDATPVNIDISQWLDMLAPNGVLCKVGLPPSTDSSFQYNWPPLIFQQKKIVGSVVTGTARTKLMLDLASQNQKVFANRPGWSTEVMPFEKLNEAMEALKNSKNAGFRILLKW